MHTNLSQELIPKALVPFVLVPFLLLPVVIFEFAQCSLLKHDAEASSVKSLVIGNFEVIIIFHQTICVLIDFTKGL